MTAAVLLGGAVRATQRVRRAVEGADLIVAADGGARHAARLGVALHLIVGDFDSLPPDGAGSAARERHPTDKDALDLELALDAAIARGARTLLLIGGMTGRLDQTLATLLIAQARHAGGLDVSVEDGVRRAWPLREGERRALPLAANERFSLHALSPEALVTLTGARYPLAHARLPRATGWGVSNEALGDVHATLHAGAAIAIAPGGRAPTRTSA